MSLCCTVNTFPFTDEAVTTIPLDAGGPTVSVYYLQPDGSYQEAGLFTSITLTGTSIVVDHGGPATGFIKVLT